MQKMKGLIAKACKKILEHYNFVVLEEAEYEKMAESISKYKDLARHYKRKLYGK